MHRFGLPCCRLDCRHHLHAPTYLLYLILVRLLYFCNQNEQHIVGECCQWCCRTCPKSHIHLFRFVFCFGLASIEHVTRPKSKKICAATDTARGRDKQKSNLRFNRCVRSPLCGDASELIDDGNTFLYIIIS